MFALFAGLVGTAYSVLIRLELSAPGVQYISDNQLYNSIITAHAIVMIFFMVEKYIFNFFLNIPEHRNIHSDSYKCNNINDKGASTSNNNNNNNDNNEKKNTEYSKFRYVKVLVEDPFNNRDIILKVTKGQKGVYIWESKDGKYKYVGRSINLYNRISSYFMPSILNTKGRRVLRYLNKYGFSHIRLTIYVMDEKSTLEELIELEQYFIDSLKPLLNVDLVASSSGYHESMSQEMRDKLRKQRGTPVYIYNAEDLTLLHIFYSKQQMYNTINIHHSTLDTCLLQGNLYLDTFFISLDIIGESTKTNLLDLDQVKELIKHKRKMYNVRHPSAKAILAEFKQDSSKNLEFHSLNSLADHLKGDRQVIRDYLKGNKQGYYRGK